jgi:ceroid-lipofuscinosis MFS transporter 7
MVFLFAQINLSQLLSFLSLASLPNHTEPVGCNATKFDWCDSVRPLSPWYFYACYILCIGLAFPNINITINTLFSKIIGPRRQGTQQGFLQMSGGVAKLVGPVVIRSVRFIFYIAL